MKIYSKGKKIEINPLIAETFFSKAIGLMFKLKSKPILFIFDKDVNHSIHSFFVFNPFLAVWLDKNKKIIECKAVNPFTFSVFPRRKYRYLLEIPLSNENKKIIKFVVGSKHLNIGRDF